MSDVTKILNAIEKGDGQAADKLLPLVYDELRRLAAQKMSQEKAGQTLQATALVHEAYIRLVEGTNHNWNSRGHFFKAAAEAMRRILVEVARRKNTQKHGGGLPHSSSYDGIEIPINTSPEEITSLDEALKKNWDRQEIIKYAEENSWNSRVEILVDEFEKIVNN